MLVNLNCTSISRVLASSGFLFVVKFQFHEFFLPHQVFLHPWKLTHPCTVSLSIMPWCWFPVSHNRIWMFQVMLWQWQIVFNRPKLFRITAWGTNDDKTLFIPYYHLFSRNHWLISIIEEFHDWVVHTNLFYFKSILLSTMGYGV